MTNALGLFGLLLACSREYWAVLWIAGAFAVLGLVFGIAAYRNDIPPRWFWSRSANEILENSVTIVIGYMVNFATYPLAWYIANDIIKTIS